MKHGNYHYHRFGPGAGSRKHAYRHSIDASKEEEQTIKRTHTSPGTQVRVRTRMRADTLARHVNNTNYTYDFFVGGSDM